MDNMFDKAISFTYSLTNWVAINKRFKNKIPKIIKNKLPPSPSGTIIDVNSVGYDPIMLQEEQINTYLNEDTNNIVFTFNNKHYLSNKFHIRRNIINNYANIKYECKKVGHSLSIRREDVYIETAMVSLSSIGIVGAGLCYYDDLAIILNTPIQAIEVSSSVDKHLISTASLSVVSDYNYIVNVVGASHCRRTRRGCTKIIRSTIIITKLL